MKNLEAGGDREEGVLWGAVLWQPARERHVQGSHRLKGKDAAGETAMESGTLRIEKRPPLFDWPLRLSVSLVGRPEILTVCSARKMEKPTLV